MRTEDSDFDSIVHLVNEIPEDERRVLICLMQGVVEIEDCDPDSIEHFVNQIPEDERRALLCLVQGVSQKLSLNEISRKAAMSEIAVKRMSASALRRLYSLLQDAASEVPGSIPTAARH